MTAPPCSVDASPMPNLTMKRSFLMSVATSCLVAVLTATTVQAQSIPLTARGVISSVQGGLSTGPLASAAAGDVFVVYFSVQIPGLAGNQGQGSDSFSVVPGSLEVAVGASSAMGVPGSTAMLDVENDVSAGDALAASFSVEGNVQGTLAATDTTGAAIPDVDLSSFVPTSLPRSLFDAASLRLQASTGGFVEGDLTVIIIGEPTTIHSTYCLSQPNSTGANGILEAFGSTAVVDNNVTLVASDLPPFSFAFVIASLDRGISLFPGGSSGTLCLGGEIGRFVGPGQVQNTLGGGSFSVTIDLTQIPQPTFVTQVVSGDTWNFQSWHRDIGPTSNFSSAIEIVFD